MKRINIVYATDGEIFFAQWNKEKYPPTEYDIRFNSDEDADWDMVVVYENAGKHSQFRCRKGALVFVSGEPPLMRPYPKDFLAQFDIVVMPKHNVVHPHHILSHGYLNWALGFGYKSHENKYSYADLQVLKTEKTKNISIVTSSKAMMPGHVLRLRIVDLLKRDFPGRIDFYGNGYNPVEFKADALLPYRFHICMENCTIPHYWTEKFSDPVLAMSVPIYSGCTNIDDYFHGEGYLKFSYEDYPLLKKIIEHILDNPKAEYERYADKLMNTRRVIMEWENLIPFAIRTLESLPTEVCVSHNIAPSTSFGSYKWQLVSLRIRRLTFRVWYSIKNIAR